MEDLLLIVAMVTAGVSLMSGLNNVFIGLSSKDKKCELIFGIQALLLFAYLIFPPTGFVLRDHPPYPLTLQIKRTFSWAFHIMYPIFLAQYSGYKNKRLTQVIFLTIFAALAMSLFAEPGAGVPEWRLLVLVPLGLIGVYGILASGYQVRNGSKIEGRWLQTAIIIYSLLYITGAYFVVVRSSLEKQLGFYPFFIFHLNSLAFIVIMSVRLSKDAFNRLNLERLLRIKESRWDQMLNHIQLLAVELTPEGKVLYCNPYALKCLGVGTIEDIKGKDWFKTFVEPEDENRLRAIFSDVLKGVDNHTSIKTRLVGLNGEECNVTWAGILLPDENDKVVSVMSLGVDTTQLDQAFSDVEKLKNELLKENIRTAEPELPGMHAEIIGNSETIVYALQKAKQVADTHATVLLEGETGVGKELFANLIHNLSERKDHPFVKVNCAALPAELIESELFGHEKGAFTGALQARKGRFELANKGTIFLDEISEMPLSLQPKLLRVLQSGEFERVGGQQTIKVDVRVISATNRDLFQEVRDEKFRQDLYYRLNVYPITIPSLRNRRSDIPLLVDHFIKKFALEFNKDIRNISKADLQRLEDYPWPGNIRELINLIERSVILSPGETLRIAWENGHKKEEDYSKPVASIRDFEREHILKVLQETNWKINGFNGAAEKLGMNPNTLRSRMKKLNINREARS